MAVSEELSFPKCVGMGVWVGLLNQSGMATFLKVHVFYCGDICLLVSRWVSAPYTMRYRKNGLGFKLRRCSAVYCTQEKNSLCALEKSMASRRQAPLHCTRHGKSDFSRGLVVSAERGEVSVIKLVPAEQGRLN